MRWKTERVLFVSLVLCGVLFVCLFGPRYDYEKIAEVGKPVPIEVKSVTCLIEGIKSLHCLKQDSEVYMPFQFVKHQFDVSGKLNNAGAFEYYTSYAKSKRPDFNNYSAFGEFGNFAFYNVERRDRVKCINGEFGVPMSIQWQKTPYFYPIQIAQFGLQHFSRHLTAGDPTAELIGRPKETANGNRIEGDLVTLNLKNDPNLSVLSFPWTPKDETSYFSVTVMSEANQVFVYSMGIEVKSFDVVRDLNIDALKAKLLYAKPAPKSEENPKTERFTPISLQFHGPADVQFPIKQQNHDHLVMFRKVADWLVHHQSQAGDWAVPVRREIVAKRLTLASGWPSAMAQGHGLSVLVRAYHLTHDQKYLDSAVRALEPYRKMAVDGGVRNDLFGHPWYEEYPTTPPTFVLNGFIYSLIGLADMAQSKTNHSRLAQTLFDEGLLSLTTFLPLFDTGSGSVYDLRHLQLKTPPNLARWDYHKVHVYLLKWMFIMTKDALFDDYSNRWLGYSMGKRAKHN